MIQIRPLASSSAGNAYLVTDGTTPLLIECGVPIRTIRRALWDHGLRLSDVRGCLVSHEHGDHSKAVRDLRLSGLPVYMSRGTHDALNLGYCTLGLQDRVEIKIGSWTVLPFRVVHDAAEPMGFLLASGDERLLFLTDTAYSPFTFSGLTHLMVECNYSREALDRSVDEGRTHPSQRQRLLHSHFSLEEVLAFLAANDLSRLRETWLLHLSDANSDEQEMLRQVRRATGRPVYVCQK